jgi:hypothetical protein
MTPDQIAAELGVITDRIAATLTGDGDRQYCLEDVESRLNILIDRIRRAEDVTATRDPRRTSHQARRRGSLPTDHAPRRETREGGSPIMTDPPARDDWPADDRTPDDLAALLRPYGPHSDEYTTAVAGVFAESVRVLNHATGSADGLAYPQTVYTVLAYLSGGTARLGQLFHQLATFLEDAAAQGLLADDTGTDPLQAVQRARRHLGTAIGHAAVLFAELSAAQNVTTSLYVPDRHRPGNGEEG